MKMIDQLNQDMSGLIIVHANTFHILYDIVVNTLKYDQLNIICNLNQCNANRYLIVMMHMFHYVLLL
jgi:hypothetical protein